MTNKKQNKEIEKIKEKIIPILKRNGVKRAGIFGSYARGEQTKDSDVDILVEFKGSLLTLIGIELEIKKILRRKVDVITYNGLNHMLKEGILSEEVRII